MTMRIGIAGGGGFAYILAQEISQSANAILVLSTRQHPEFEELGAQVAVVDYADAPDLRYAVQGLDLVISTISGQSQLNLIDAARHAQIRTFVPSEFEGVVANRPRSDDPLDRGSAAALRLLDECSRSTSNGPTLRYTVFSCGVFYERFQPGGLGAMLNIGAGSNVHMPGSFLLNVNTGTAEIVNQTAQGRPVAVSMTSVYDVARFVAAALEIGPDRWPREFRMRGDQLSVMDIVSVCSTASRIPIQVTNHEYRNIQAHLDWCAQQVDVNRWYYFQRLKAAADGRYAFARANLNELVAQTDGVEVRPVRFGEWARRVWAQYHQQQQQQLQQSQLGNSSHLMQLG